MKNIIKEIINNTKKVVKLIRIKNEEYMFQSYGCFTDDKIQRVFVIIYDNFSCIV